MRLQSLECELNARGLPTRITSNLMSCPEDVFDRANRPGSHPLVGGSNGKADASIAASLIADGSLRWAEVGNIAQIDTANSSSESWIPFSGAITAMSSSKFRMGRSSHSLP